MFDTVKLARANLALDPVHDDRHELPHDPLGRESIPYTIHIPEQKIAAFTYTWVNQAGEAGAALALFGPGIGDKPVQQRLADRKVPDSMRFDNWQIENFSMQQDLQFKHADVRWQTPEATLEFHFEALHPPYAYGSHAGGCPAFCAVNRIEQSGRVQGRITLPDREIAFETMGHRDHSWGIRAWKTFQFYHWFEGKSADGSIVVHYWRYLALGRENIRGYVVKDGLMAEITDLKTDVQYDTQLWQQQLQTTVWDEAGRTTDVSAEFYASYPLIPAPEIELREAAASAVYDGKPGLAWLEVGWPSAYLK